MWDLDRVFAECLDLIERGELTPDQALALYPQARDELQSLLRLAHELRQFRQVEAPPIFKRAARERLVARMHADLAASPVRTSAPTGLLDRLAQRRLTRLAGLTVGVVLLLGGATAVQASEQSRPGELLYPLKSVSERLQVTLARTDDERVAAYLAIADNRLAELDYVATQGDPALAADLARRYAGALDDVQRALAILSREPSDGVVAFITDHQSRAQGILQHVSEKVPETALPAIQGSLGQRATDQRAAGPAAERSEPGPAAGRADIAPNGRSDSVATATSTTEPEAAQSPAADDRPATAIDGPATGDLPVEQPTELRAPPSVTLEPSQGPAQPSTKITNPPPPAAPVEQPAPVRSSSPPNPSAPGGQHQWVQPATTDPPAAPPGQNAAPPALTPPADVPALSTAAPSETSGGNGNHRPDQPAGAGQLPETQEGTTGNRGGSAGDDGRGGLAQQQPSGAQRGSVGAGPSSTNDRGGNAVPSIYGQDDQSDGGGAQPDDGQPNAGGPPAGESLPARDPQPGGTGSGAGTNVASGSGRPADPGQRNGPGQPSRPDRNAGTSNLGRSD
ncbi:MAG TPA: DUF5667 domain-containing protein [Dehalococcoidia bacterium]|nr:DUF5667 domain-containing protein [Dehalococcoidia bacterium]